jgi:transposase InsO family protein
VASEGIILTEAQVAALERKKHDDVACGEIETAHPGYLGSQDTFFEQHELPMLRILTDRGTEYCGCADQHDYPLYLALNDIEHTKTKVRSPQTNGICERFHKTILQEFYQVALGKKIYSDIESLQMDLDEWILYYNTERTHQGKMCCGRTPLATLEDGKD